jgi:aminomethyltransferase
MPNTDLCPPKTPVRRLPLHGLHSELGASFIPFAGYEMPVNYALGVLKEHLHTRAAASFFDVSHMGQIVIRPHSGNMGDAAGALESLMPVDVLGLPPFRMRYAFFTNPRGGIIDDLMIGHFADHFLLVVNASRKDTDYANLRDGLSSVCTIELLEDRALLSLQGPAAEAVLARVAPAVASMRFMDIRAVSMLGTNCIVSRSGYTGEDGFEISIHTRDAENFARTLLQNPAVKPVGLGARDSLRIEAGLCLYGADIDESTTPVEAALEWAISKVRCGGGARAGNFPGADIILDHLGGGAPRRRVGLKPHERTPVRGGALLYSDDSTSRSIGSVTSGVFSPSLAAPVAMGYVPSGLATPDRTVSAEVRGKRHAIEVTALAFMPHRYKTT